MEFTGERFVPGTHGNIKMEHFHPHLPPSACKQACFRGSRAGHWEWRGIQFRDAGHAIGGSRAPSPGGLLAFLSGRNESFGRFSQLEVHEGTTQWQDEGYADGSDWWHDSVLVCRKPDHGFCGI
jgi:hypothetical protein